MPTVKTPHFRFPFRIPTDSAAVVEQDTFDEVAQCVQILLMTPLGSRIEVPTFGIEDPVFSIESASRQQRMFEAVNKWEPRAQAKISVTVDNVDEFLHHVRAEIVDRPDPLNALPYFDDGEPTSEEGEDTFGGGAWGTGSWGD